MKALTIRQPHVGWIFSEGKDVENRGRGTSYRGPLLIHSSKTIDEQALHKFGLVEPSGTGVIIGMVTLVDCTFLVTSEWHDLGMVGWYLRDPVVFAKAIPFRGQQFLFDVPESALVEVM